MNIAITDVSESRKNLVVTLDPAEVAAEHRAVVADISRQVRLPGFRPGKAPAAMVQTRYAKEIGEEFKQKVVAKAYRGGLEQSKLDVIQVVEVQEGTIAADAEASITFTLDLRPDFALPDYNGIPTEVRPTEVADAEIDAALDAMRGEQADFKEADRPSQKGDYVKLAYEGSVDGQPILDLAPDKQIYGKVPQTWEEVGGREGLIPGLGAQLEGLAKGDKREVSVSFPADFAAVPALGGRTAVYAVEILEVRERVLPPIDEEFLKASNADSLEALRERLGSGLRFRKEQENRAAQRQQVLEALVGRVDFPLPESLIESETQGVLRRFIEENMQRGVPAEQFEKDKAQLVEGARQRAALQVKQRLILAKIAAEEKVQVENEDFDLWIRREAMRTNTAPDKIVKDLTKDRDYLRVVQQGILLDKALELVVSKATVTNLQPQG